MSILVLVPFDMKSIDSTSKLTDTIVKHSIDALATTGKCRDGAALMLARICDASPTLLRADAWKRVIHDQLKVGYLTYSKDPLSLNNTVGMLQGIVEILRTGERKELMADAKELIKLISEETECKSALASTILRKFKVKLAERIGPGASEASCCHLEIPTWVPIFA